VSILNSSKAWSLPALVARAQIRLHRVSDWLSAALRRRDGKRQLAQLDDHLLRDIGLTRHDIGRPPGKLHSEPR
jgi:uncharacterized protein YjiS (DUF1127 family)